ncbi:MAG: beta strand repeat-containing protein, partial [Planctomycetaceae bacterium]
TSSAVISGTGTIANAGSGTTTLAGATSLSATLAATAGRLIVGDGSSVAGFATVGGLSASAGATLELRSKGLASVNGLSTLGGGTIQAANGISLGSAANVVGAGTISGFVSAVQGSRIEADGGKLTIGDAGSYIGFSSDGLLYTNANEVELVDRNVAVLGSLTQLGTGVTGGSLRAANGMLLEQGKNLVGRGTVYGNFVNQGDVYGDGPTAGQQLVFAAGSTVSGNGSFTNALFNGTYAPGNSPAITNITNGGFGNSSTLLVEIGGTQAGAQYDQVQNAGTLSLLGGTLNVVLTNSFMPAPGDSFQILGYGQLAGDFGTVSLPVFDNGLGWQRLTTGTSMRLVATRLPVSIDVATGSETLASTGYSSLAYAAALSKTGTGTLILNAADAFAGATSIQQGVLAITNSAAISSSPLVSLSSGAGFDVGSLSSGYTVPSGQTIAGAGTVLGSVTFGRGSTLSPGMVSSASGASTSGADMQAGSLLTIVVPEPAALGLVGVGLGFLGLGALRRRRVA